MTRSTKTLRGAALVAALALPALASAQDTIPTTRDSAGARMNGIRFDASQAVTLSSVTIVRIDSTAGGGSRGGMRGNDANGMGGMSGRPGSSAGTTGSGMGSTGAGSTGAGSTGTGSAGMPSSGTAGAPGSATSPSGSSGMPASGGMGTERSAGRGNAGGAGQTLHAIVRSGTDTMLVILGPSDFLSSRRLTLNTGDVISVKGVRIDGMGGMGGRNGSAGTTANPGMGAPGMGAPGTTPGATSGSVPGGAPGSTTGGTTGTSGMPSSASASGSAGTTIGASGPMTTVLATEITKGNTTVQLRDRTSGQPSWPGAMNDGMKGGRMPRDTAGTSPTRIP